MKYIESPELAHLTMMLTNVDTGEAVVNGRIESYSCKQAAADKKLFRELDRQVSTEVGHSPHSVVSEIGPLVCIRRLFLDVDLKDSQSELQTRRILFNLIATLNAVFPDYDFGLVNPELFKRETSLSRVQNSINASLAEVFDTHKAGGNVVSSPLGTSPPLYSYGGYSSLCDTLWQVLEAEVATHECEIYTYAADQPESDPFSEEGVLWSFNYFFYNRKMRKIVYFFCRAFHPAVSPSPCPSEDELEGFFGFNRDERENYYRQSDSDDADMID